MPDELFQGEQAIELLSHNVKTDLSRNRSIMAAVFINGAAGWVMAITLSFCISTMDLGQVLDTPTGFPFIQVFLNVTGTAGGATAMTIFPIIFVRTLSCPVCRFR